MGTPSLPTFPEVLLAHASPNDWPIVVKYANRMQIMTSIIKCAVHDNYVRISEHPRLWLYGLQLAVEVRSSEGGAWMATPLQCSGEYDIFLKQMSPSALDQW